MKIGQGVSSSHPEALRVKCGGSTLLQKMSVIMLIPPDDAFSKLLFTCCKILIYFDCSTKC